MYGNAFYIDTFVLPSYGNTKTFQFTPMNLINNLLFMIFLEQITKWDKRVTNDIDKKWDFPQICIIKNNVWKAF